MRAFLLFGAIAMSLQAGVILGARYGQLSHQAELNDIPSEEKNAKGVGFIVGYERDNFRIVATRDEPGFEEPAQATLTALGIHLIDQPDPDMKGFLGFGFGQLDYRHSSQPKTDDPEMIDLYGIEVGLILLDERFENMQMEIGYRYFKTHGDLPETLDLPNLSHVYIGLNFDLF